MCVEEKRKEMSILEELKTDCPFPEVFADIEVINGRQQYRRKIGHIRADYKERWWSTVIPCHIPTPDMAVEIDRVYEGLTADDAFRDLDALRDYCRKHPEAKASKNCNDEYNFYFVGTQCLYWIRCITRLRDYNLYLHAFSGEQEDHPCKAISKSEQLFRK